MSWTSMANRLRRVPRHALLAGAYVFTAPMAFGGDGGEPRPPVDAGRPTVIRPSFTPPTSFAPLVAQVQNAVVHVAVDRGETVANGSGFFISGDGFVVTNQHVVGRDGEITVSTSTGETFPARVVGTDAPTDIALLRVVSDAGVFSSAELGSADALQVGDWVLAIGSPLTLDLSVTAGIVSARQRSLGMGPYDDFIQVSAPINPGSSGGPLFDMSGRVVAVATSVLSSAQAIGFGIPVDLVKSIVPILKAKGKVTRGWAGWTIRELSMGKERWLQVTAVEPDGPAAKAGILAGDVVRSVDGRAFDRFVDLKRKFAALEVGTTLSVGLERNRKKLTVKPVLASKPAPPVER